MYRCMYVYAFIYMKIYKHEFKLIMFIKIARYV